MALYSQVVKTQVLQLYKVSISSAFLADTAYLVIQGVVANFSLASITNVFSSRHKLTKALYPIKT